MTPPKLLTVDEIIELKKSYVLFGDVGDDLETLLETALAAMRALQGVYLSDKTPEYEYGQPDRQGRKPGTGQRWKTPKEIAKPFQQTGEDKGGRGDESECNAKTDTRIIKS